MFKKEKFWLFIIFIFALLSCRGIIRPGYFPMHDDLQMMRQLEMEKCFLDGQIPCRWVPDMGYGFGYPLFNFYPPLPYLIGQGIRVLGFHFTDTARFTFSLSLLASGVAMYFLAKEFFGRLGATLAAIFYIWAPYHAVDVYVRGAMNEAWSLVWFPLILLTSYRLITDKKQVIKWTLGLALTWTALLLSHNLMAPIFGPVFALWILLWLVRLKSWRRILNMAISGILAFGLAAFFTLPALLETKLVQVKTLISGYYDFTAHYVSLRQIFISRFWGYGASVFETNDGMAFPIGHLHWMVAFAVAAFVFLRLVKQVRKRKVDNLSLVVIFFVGVGLFAAFMAHQRSYPIWQAISILKFVQFPWRFLTLNTLAFSFVAGAIPALLNEFKSSQGFILKFITGYLEVSVFVLLTVGVVALNWNYFKPERMGPVTDTEKFSGEAWKIQQTAGIYDYLPVTAKIAPQEPRKTEVEAMAGDAEFKGVTQGTYWLKFNAKVLSDKAHIRINILDFPNWRVFIDGRETKVFIPEDEKWGRMQIEVPQGDHLVYAQLFNTPVRTAANIISLVSWGILFSYPIWRKKIALP